MTEPNIDYQELLSFIARFVGTTPEDRQATVGAAFFGEQALLQSIDWTGNNQTFAYHLTRRLLEYGEVNSRPALIILLEDLRGKLGVNWQAKIDEMITALSDEKELERLTIIIVEQGKPGRWNNIITGANLLIGAIGAAAAIIAVGLAWLALLPDEQRDHYLYRVGVVNASDTPTPTRTPSATPTVTLTPSNTPTATNTPTITPTPLEGEPFTDEVFGVILANFTDLDGRADDIVRRIERGFEDNDIDFIRVTHPIDNSAEAKIIRDLYNATVVIWGESTDFGAEVLFEMASPRSRVIRPVDGIALSEDIDNFKSIIYEGMDTTYVVKFVQGQIHYFNNEYATALSLFRQAADLMPDGREFEVGGAALYHYIGFTEYRLGDADASLRAYTRALELNPANPYTFYNRAKVYYDTQQTESALVDYSRAIEIDPEYANAYYNRGSIYNDLQEYELALADYDRAIELNPKDPAFFTNRGGTYLEQGEYDLAVSDFSQAIELAPDYAVAYNNRSVVYKNRNETDLALADLNRAIEIAPDYASAYQNRGIVYLENGEYKRAIDDFSAAIQLGYTEAYLPRAFIYAQLDDNEKALADFREYEALGGTLPPPLADLADSLESDLAAQN